MAPEIRLLVSIMVSISFSFLAAATTEYKSLPLMDVQRILRTDLDSELAKITLDDSPVQKIQKLSDTSSIHSKQRSNVRRRNIKNNQNDKPVSIPASNGAASDRAVDRIWSNVLEHAWDVAKSIRRSSIGSFVREANTDGEAIPCPFLVCTMDIKGPKRQSSYTNHAYDDLISAFNKSYEETLLVKSAHNETCTILTLSTSVASQGMRQYQGEQNMAMMPLVDVMKIQSGTVDEVSSLGWTVPYRNSSNAAVSNKASISANITEKLNQWERLITVDFAPGLGGMKEESELLKVVNTMISDIQDMGEVGYLQRLNEQERRAYEVDESIALVPALSEIFSLTATLNNSSDVREDNRPNTRVEFWNDAFERGIESQHACSEMFSTLFVKPRSGYYSFDIILNPADGPPPSDYNSSASNPACVTSFVAGLSTHRE